MRLKRLEIKGYKSFAAHSEFIFDSNITAIVGPNGSGKSNIADAIKWVLGEQSYSTLRGKRTEDMIFSGSTQRARLGMAQAIITIDNEDQSLPIDYNEVTIERRAYRSGENEYHLNGNRVRLRDINDLLSAARLSRRTYAVIGQGLVDAALSLRPEERRLLFEEAAGITAYQSKRTDAVNRLKETTQNIIRVNDIINEIQPRLKRLHRQAGQAKEYHRADQELHGLLLEWYGFRWNRTQQALADTIATVRNQGKQIETCQTELEALERQIAERRSRQNAFRQQLGEWHRQSSHLHSQSEAGQRDLAIRQERRRQIEIQREELIRELVPLRTSRDGQEERRKEAEAELARLDAEIFQQRTQARELESQLAALRTRHQDLLAEVTGHQNKIFHLSTQTADHKSRIAQIGERRESIAEEQQTHYRSVQEHTTKKEELSRQLGTLREGLADLDREIETRQAGQAQLRQSVARHKEKQIVLQAQINEVRGELEQRRVRHESLSRLREEMSDYYAGVQAVLGHQAEGQFPGLLGTVAGLVEVDPSLEKAIEVALGNHIQDIVAESWDAAQGAIAYLKKHRAGRATFLPLDSLRPTRPLQSPKRPGVVGLALDLVSFDEKLHPVFELVLGHTIIVETLEVAHGVFKELRGGFQIVTPDGEIVRSSGAISGGSPQKRQRGLLTREREWRELPARISQASDRCDELKQEEKALSKTTTNLLRQIEQGEERAQQLAERREELARQQEERQQDMAQLMREIEWRRTLMGRLQEELANLDATEGELNEDQETLHSQMARSEDLANQINLQIAELENDPAQEEMTNMRTQIALTERAIDNQRVILENHWRALRDLERQIEAKEKRAGELATTIETLISEIDVLSTQTDELSGAIADLANFIQSVEAELADVEKYLDDIGPQETYLRNRLRTQESIYAQVNLDAQRRRDELDNLRRQIEEELGFLVETDIVEDVETQQPLPLKPLVERLQTVTQISPNLENEIRQLRAMKQRLGTVNPNALDEYNEARERHAFLTSQAADLQEAATSLHTVIAELDELMTRDFTKTFRAIASEFKDYFSVLFGGGSARITLTEPDDPLSSGIEIIAKPPGKRQQSLNLLSGGERALIAAALVFAILKISPTPFCVLDEVDAMLDEANVGRFRDTLCRLAENTQFILITHNRHTIEAAQTIYGISMGDDNTSVIVSLKLEEDEESSERSQLRDGEDEEA